MSEKPQVESGVQMDRDPVNLLRLAETHIAQAKHTLESIKTEEIGSDLVESATKLGTHIEELDTALTSKRQLIYTSLLKSVIALKVQMPISYNHGIAPRLIKSDGGIYYRNGDCVISGGEIGTNSIYWEEATSKLIEALQECARRSKRLNSEAEEISALKTSLEKLVAEIE